MPDTQRRQQLIENCLEKRLTRFEVNSILKNHDFEELQGGEADCYDVMLNSAKSTNPRQKIIAGCLIQGLSKTEANLKLFDYKFRKLTDTEITDYEDILSRIRFCGIEIQKELKKETKKEEIPSFEKIIESSILNKLSPNDANTKLQNFGYAKMTDAQECDYKIKFNRFHNKRESLIQEGFESCKSIKEDNKILKENNLSILNILEEMSYQKERDRIYAKKRKNIIKECIEEKMSRFETDKILTEHNFEKLTDEEVNQLNNEAHSIGTNQTKRKTTELSDQFRKLYRKATKLFHPDRFRETEKRNIATVRMKEINEAKDKNDYFLLKNLVDKYEREDLAEI